MDRADLTADAAEYLRIGIEPVTADNPLSDEEAQTVPEWWSQLAELDAAQSTELILAQWDPALPGLLPRFGQSLTDYGHSSLSRIVSESYHGIAVMYVFTVPDEDPIYLFGYPPTTTPPALVAELPDSVQTFYTKIHDGLLDHIEGEPAGLYRSRRLIDWQSLIGDSVLKYIANPPANPPLARNLIMFYTDGAGGFIFINKDQQDNAVWTAGAGLLSDLSWGKMTLWDVVDDWITLFVSADDDDDA
ncbi:hypothetical protein QN239_03490 [Mycolicibacterium sp. Y3]